MSANESSRLLGENNGSYSINGPSYDTYAMDPADIIEYPPDDDFEDFEGGESDLSTHFEPHARKPFIPASDSAMAFRMRYYNKLAAGVEETQETPALRLPAHVVPSSLFFPSMASIFGGVETEEEVEEKKQSDIKLIFSIWNTMMGSSLLALPWGFGQSGLTTGIMLVFCIGAFCCYTCTLIIRHGKDSADFFYLCNDYLGTTGKILCWISSIAVLIGGVIAYDILMSEIMYSSSVSLLTILYNILGYSTDHIGESWYWNSYVTPIVVVVIMFPICSMKSFGIIVTINSLGVISIMYTLVFLVAQCTIEQGLTFSEVPEINKNLFVLAGLLSISFYIHGMILPIIRSAKNPQNNIRNVILGYLLVALSYAVIGSVGYLAYWHGEYAIPQEFLTIYESYGTNTHVGVVLANLLLLFQLATVFPLLLLIIRIQFFGLIMKSQYPGFLYIVALNVVLIGIGTFFALFFRNFGSILSVTGAIFGTIIVFFLPILVHLRAMKQKTGKHGFWRTLIHVSILILSVVVAVGQFAPAIFTAIASVAQLLGFDSTWIDEHGIVDN